MPTGRIALVGAGGHGAVVLDAIRACEKDQTVEVYDSDPTMTGRLIDGMQIHVFSGIDDLPDRVHVSVGDNEARRHIGCQIEESGRLLLSVIHPEAHVSRSTHIGKGSFIAAAAVIGPRAEVGWGVVANHSCVIDHDCRVGSWSHVAPNATLGGGVVLGEGVLIGSSAVVLPGLSIGDGAVVGAGAVVTHPIPSGQVVFGVPAQEGGGR